MRLPAWVVAPVKLVTSAMRHPNTAQAMIITGRQVEVMRVIAQEEIAKAAAQEVLFQVKYGGWGSP